MKDQLQREVFDEIHRLDSGLQALSERVERQEVSKEKMETVCSVASSQESLRESHDSLEKRCRKMSLQLNLCQRRAEDAAGEAQSQVDALREELGQFREENQKTQKTEVLRKDVEDLRVLSGSKMAKDVPKERAASLTRRKVPEGRRHACWQGCPRCQGTRPPAMRGSPLRDHLGASDFADAFKDDLASDVHDLVDASEASCRV